MVFGPELDNDAVLGPSGLDSEPSQQMARACNEQKDAPQGPSLPTASQHPRSQLKFVTPQLECCSKR